MESRRLLGYGRHSARIALVSLHVRANGADADAARRHGAARAETW